MFGALMRYFNYRPARLVKGKRWYVEYYYEVDGSLKREREYFYLTRIKDQHERLKLALQKVSEINDLLPKGYPHTILSEKIISLDDALKIAMTAKSKTDRTKTVRTYQTVVNRLYEFLGSKHVRNGSKGEAMRTGENHANKMQLSAFTQYMAFEFLDWAYIHKGIGSTTYNKYKNLFVGLFNELKKRKYITVNPFSEIEKLKETEKERRGLEENEKKMLINHIESKNKGLWLAVRLIYYCFIRPKELRDLQVKHIHLDKRFIKLPGSITKNKKTEIVTIPTGLSDDIYNHIKNCDDGNKYVFGGKAFLPSDNQCGTNAMNTKHRECLDELLAMKRMKNIEGISIYSWKDTGALDLVNKNINIYDIMRQMRHSELSTTQKYIKSLGIVNDSILNIDVDF